MQLGKLGASQSRQILSCKTGDFPCQGDQWLTSEKQNSTPLDLIVERNDGLFQIGLDDESSAGPFMSRQHAMAVAAKVAA
jgi:hypothetical protein